MWYKRRKKHKKNNIIKQIPEKYNENMDYNFMNTQNYIRWKQNVSDAYMLYLANKVIIENNCFFDSKLIFSNKCDVLFENIIKLLDYIRKKIFWDLNWFIILFFLTIFVIIIPLLLSIIYYLMGFSINSFIITMNYIILVLIGLVSLILIFAYLYTYLIVELDIPLIIIWFVIIYGFIFTNNTLFFKLIVIPIFIYLLSFVYIFLIWPVILLIISFFKPIIKYIFFVMIYYTTYFYNLINLYFFSYKKYFFIIRNPNTKTPWKILFQNSNAFISENSIIIKK